MLNYSAMNPLRRVALAFAALLIPLSSFGQGIRMPADFLPLDVGTRWTYELTDPSGAKVGQMAFGVEEYTIIGGTSFYALTEFPFTEEKSDKGEPIRLIRYDRTERQFIRKLGNDEGPLFLDNGASTEVLQSDAQGTAQKFLLRMATMTLTFQRGVGIVEAKLNGPAGVVTAKLSTAQGKSLTTNASPVPAPAPARAPSRGAAPPPPIPAAPPLPPPPPPASNRRESPTAVLSSCNPRIDVGAMPSDGGYDLVMIVTNMSDKLLPFRFSSGQTYDFVISDAGGKEVWRWSKGQFFTQVVRSDSIRPNDKWRFDAKWDGRDSDGNKIPGGSYRLTGTVTSLPAVRSIPVSFDVR
jgi:hypothetical protein